MSHQLRLFLFACVAFAFTGERFILRKTLPSDATQLTSDNLGNFYLVRNDVLEKYDASGSLLKTYSNKSYGRISSVDATNAMKLLIFYRDFSRIVFLDNSLSPLGEPVSLQELGYSSVPLVCTANKGGIWLYNQQLPELVRLDVNLQPQESSGNILEAAGDILPQRLMEYNDRLFLYSAKKGILVFDNYGTYTKTLPLPAPDFQVREDRLLYIHNRQLFSYDMKTLAEDSLQLPDTSAWLQRSEKDRLILQCRASLKIYSIKQ
jgi:hypothetical protein